MGEDVKKKCKSKTRTPKLEPHFFFFVTRSASSAEHPKLAPALLLVGKDNSDGRQRTPAPCRRADSCRHGHATDRCRRPSGPHRQEPAYFNLVARARPYRRFQRVHVSHRSRCACRWLCVCRVRRPSSSGTVSSGECLQPVCRLRTPGMSLRQKRIEKGQARLPRVYE